MSRRTCIILSTVLSFACSDDALVSVGPTGPTGEPDVLSLGRTLAAEFIELNLEGLSTTEVNAVLRGSYLVNGAAGCIGCHGGPAGYLAGGNEFNVGFLPPDVSGHTSIFARNLTPHPQTGLRLNEAEFIEAMRTGKDFSDSESGPASRMLFMPTQSYRFMVEADLKAIYAYLKRIPPVSNPLRTDYVPPFPFPPVPAPPLSDANTIGRGLEIPQFLVADADANTIAPHFDAALAGVSQAERDRFGRGSYLVNAVSDCNGCHTDGTPDGFFDSGLLPGTMDVNPAGYLAGGVNLGLLFGIPFPVLSRNLTPHEEHGLDLTEEQFINVFRFGADYRRPGGSLRVLPHFPSEFRMTLEDVRAVYTYLTHLPPIDKKIDITP